MRLKVGKTYIKKERRMGFIIALAIIMSVLITVVVIELLPSGVPELGYSEQNGIGRTFMYPFIFTDAVGDLHIIDENNKVTTIDNDTEAGIHDTMNSKVYYLKNNELFEYDIKNNYRISLCDDISSFELFGNRRCIACKDTTGRILLYMFKGNELKLLSQEPYGEATYLVGDEGVVYTNGTSLYYCDYVGNNYTITDKYNSAKPFYISDNHDVCFYEGNTMYISNKKGEVKESFVNGEPVLFKEVNVLIQPTTTEKSGSDTIPFSYFLSDIAMILDTEESDGNVYSAGQLQYFDGRELRDIAENIYKVIYYSQTDDFLIYSVLNGENTDIYMTEKGGKPKKQITCSSESSFLFDSKSNYLYINENGKLRRYDIFDVDHSIIEISNNIENMYDYKNKPFITYTDEAQKYMYYIKKDTIEKTNLSTELRLYGRSHESYLMCNVKESGLMTLDYVNEDKMTRIADNIGSNIFFDRDLEYVFYNKGADLYLWSLGESKHIGVYEGVKAVEII